MTTDRHLAIYSPLLVRLEKVDRKKLKKFARKEGMTETDVVRELIRNHCVDLTTD